MFGRFIPVSIRQKTI